jgi:DNA repair exonuclease SbcCD ATPase subunit
MYIRQATIKNFQSHKHTVFNFHAGVNVVIGETDKGKSAIIRSLGWLIRNRSEDRGFRSRWGGKTDVEAVFSDGKVVSRVQDKDNAYYLYDTTENIDEEYKAFKKDIPEDIVNALNMGDINIQSQFDPPFLLADSGGDVAKLLNKIANLSDIDTSISNIRKEVLANAAEIRKYEEQVITLEEQKESFQYIPAMEKAVTQYEELCKQDKICDSTHFALGVIVSNIGKCDKELAEIEAFLKAEAGCNAALALTEQEKLVTGQIRAIETLIESVYNSQEHINEAELFIQAEHLMQPILELTEKLDEIQKESTELQTAIKRINLDAGKIRTVEKNLDSYTMEFEALMPNQCPLCGK